jgi:hypothetical protein
VFAAWKIYLLGVGKISEHCYYVRIEKLETDNQLVAGIKKGNNQNKLFPFVPRTGIEPVIPP